MMRSPSLRKRDEAEGLTAVVERVIRNAELCDAGHRPDGQTSDAMRLDAAFRTDQERPPKMQLDDLDRIATAAFEGYVVRKDVRKYLGCAPSAGSFRSRPMSWSSCWVAIVRCLAQGAGGLRTSKNAGRAARRELPRQNTRAA